MSNESLNPDGTMKDVFQTYGQFSRFVFAETGEEINFEPYRDDKDRHGGLLRGIIFNRLPGTWYRKDGTKMTQGLGNKSEILTENMAGAITIYAPETLDLMGVTGLRTVAEKLGLESKDMKAEDLKAAILEKQSQLVAEHSEG